MPVHSVFGAWLEKASRKDILLFLKVWGISLFLPYLKMLAPALEKLTPSARDMMRAAMITLRVLVKST